MFINSPLFSLKIGAAVALLLTLLPSSAKAAIVWSESSISEGANFWYNQVERSTSIMGFDEEQGVVLDQAIPHQMLNEWDDLRNLLYLDSGLQVDSHMLYFAKSNSISQRITAEATVKFSGEIVGLIGDSSLFYPYNYLFAPDATHRQSSRTGWTLEEELSWTPLDEVQFLSEDTLYLNWTTHSAIDPLRVITISPTGSTQYVPEPLTLLGAGSAIAMGGFFKSKLKNKAKDS